jgi:putative radical SAM enzyme (TIGR03279 family)
MNGGKVEAVEFGSYAWDAGIRADDVVLSVNNYPLRDWLDYLDKSYAKELLVIYYSTIVKQVVEKRILKAAGQPLGITFCTPVFDGLKVCANNCIFCFLQQTVPDLRPTLYIRDDDYRLSFLDGNYITLSNLNEDDLARITAQKLSPLYISVHSTDERIRRDMLRSSKELRPILFDLRFLSEHGIDLYIQIVVCPHFNDGESLRKTMLDLRNIQGIQKVAIVPVGLTKFREKCTDIKAFNRNNARDLINLVADIDGSKENAFFALADEFFLLADVDIPDANYYGDFELYDNGVGMLRDFIDDFQFELSQTNELKADIAINEVCILTGFAASYILEELFQLFYFKFGSRPKVCAVVNEFWGEMINVAGLLTGADIIKTIKDSALQSKLFLLPDSLLSRDGHLTLDGYTIREIELETGFQVKAIHTSGKALLDEFREERNE